jgi:hypothetical protein
MKKISGFLITVSCIGLISVGLNALAVQEFTPRQQSQPKVLKKPQLTILPLIKHIEPFYDDCQLIFYIKGNFFGQNQGTRSIRLQSTSQVYTPQITKWTPSQIDCLLKGNFELGRNYKVYLWDTAANKIGSNQFNWVVKTRLSLKNQGYKPGQVIGVGGCLLGNAQGARKLIIGNVETQVTQWVCEDIVLKVPNLPPGTYPLFLREGRLVISNTINIKIL